MRLPETGALRAVMPGMQAMPSTYLLMFAGHVPVSRWFVISASCKQLKKLLGLQAILSCAVHTLFRVEDDGSVIACFLRQVLARLAPQEVCKMRRGEVVE